MKYVGRTKGTVQGRWSAHISVAKRGSSTHLHRALRKYGEENFVIEILEDNIPREFANERERYWVTHFNTFNEGYNMTAGGGGLFGYKHSEATKEKCRRANLGRPCWKKGKSFPPLPLEMRRKISEKLKGRPSPMKGRRLSQEQRRRMSASRLGPLNPAYGRKRPDLAERNKVSQVWIRKDGQEKKIPLSQLSYFLELGFEYGRVLSLCGTDNPNYGRSAPHLTAHNRIPFSWMNDGSVNKRVFKEAVDAYAKLGFVPGRVKKGHK
jgi:group I intron endonuclease